MQESVESGLFHFSKYKPFTIDHEGQFLKKKDIHIHEYTYVVKVTANGKVETKLTTDLL